MKTGLLAVLGLILMSGCSMSSNIRLENGMLIQEAGQTNMFRPSMSVMQVSKCVQEEGITTVIDVDGNTETCYGRFVPVATVQGTQPGSMTGVFGAMVQGGAIVGGAYLLADGIRDSGSTTTNNNANDTSSTGGTSGASAGSTSISGAKATSQSISKGGAGGMGGSVNNGMPMRGRD